MYFLLYIFKFFANLLYGLFKLLPVKNQVCFFSRQSDSITLDFKLLIDEINRRDSDVQIKVICNRFSSTSNGIFRFAKNLLLSMYYLSQSKVCIIDAYWPMVSILKHKKCLKVIQIWHSIGKIKKSGYQNIGTVNGRDEKLARIMCMHKNYDYVIAGSKIWNPYYCESFNITEDKILNYGLPRLDALLKRRNRRSELIMKYPELQNKKIVFYAPTYRPYPINSYKELGDCFNDKDEYVFIYKLHPRQKISSNMSNKKSKYILQEDVLTLIAACDYFVTDYSSLALEAALLDKKTLYYLFDNERYLRDNGCNINLMEMMPKLTFKSSEDVYNMIHNQEYPMDELVKYKKMFLPEELGTSTEKIANLILENLT